MDFYDSVTEFFEMLQRYSSQLIDYLDDQDLYNLLVYLFNCFPGEVIAVFFISFLFILFLGFRKALS